jgi:hypothetical protein
MSNADLETWRDGFLTALHHLRQPGQGLTPPPGGGDPQARLAVLLQARAALGPEDQHPDPWRDVATRLAGSLAETSRPNMVDALLRSAGAIDSEIIRALDAGAEVPSVIHTEAFQEVIPYGPERLAAGKVASLPDGHPLRTLLPEEEFFKIDRDRVLLLGPLTRPLAGRPAPRAFYMTNLAVALTREHGANQQWKAEDEARRVRQAERQGQRLTL